MTKRDIFLILVCIFLSPFVYLFIFLKRKIVLFFSNRKEKIHLKLLLRKNKQINSIFPSGEDLSQLNMISTSLAGSFAYESRLRLLDLKNEKERIVKKCKQIGIPDKKINLFNN